ncbi:MAG TPA: class I SAM-dependent methyltransferase, partial [Xanthomonadaceae bacterium]|nr:class I SAM-dependent methyltransferase [Xanthomonadaceae bacterium]
LDSLPTGQLHDAATCFLVSQFILEPEARSAFFREIADRLKPGGILASSDLASDTGSPEYAALLRTWLQLMASGGVTPEGLERMRQAYARDVAVLPPEHVASIIRSGGFDTPVRFFQAGLIHAWYFRRASPEAV